MAPTSLIALDDCPYEIPLIILDDCPYEIRQAIFSAIIDLYFKEKPGCRDVVFWNQDSLFWKYEPRDDMRYSSGSGIKLEERPHVELALRSGVNCRQYYEEFRALRVRKSNITLCATILPARKLAAPCNLDQTYTYSTYDDWNEHERSASRAVFMEISHLPKHIAENAVTVKIVLPDLRNGTSEQWFEWDRVEVNSSFRSLFNGVCIPC